MTRNRICKVRDRSFYRRGVPDLHQVLEGGAHHDLTVHCLVETMSACSWIMEDLKDKITRGVRNEPS